MMTNQKSAINISQVTPELAAQIVKHFVLPMFETDAKKGLKKKYSKFTSDTKSPTIRSNSTASILANKRFKLTKPEPPQTVFGELKLTETLFDELSKVKNQYD